MRIIHATRNSKKLKNALKRIRKAVCFTSLES